VLQPLSPCPLMSADPVPPYTWPSWRQLRLGLVHLASPMFCRHTGQVTSSRPHAGSQELLLSSVDKALSQLLMQTELDLETLNPINPKP
jgi:hypothetical protein